MIFFNIGWMKNYNGVTDDDKPKDGGSWDEKHEVCNFSNVEGRCYGFVYQTNLGPIDLGSIGADLKSDHIDGVTVVWTAKHANYGTVVVGWYRNAIVYRSMQQLANSPIHQANNVGQFYAECALEDAVLLPEAGRKFPIPRGKGGMGQHLIWYGNTTLGPQTKLKLSKYIDDQIEAQTIDAAQIARIGSGANTIGGFVPGFDALVNDISFIEKSDDSPSVKATLINARLGQGKFRKHLDMFWNESCAVTGCSIRDVLRASHVKPWRECVNNIERLDPDNGLLLSAHLDALFDKGLISFNDDGSMLVSNRITPIDMERLGLSGRLKKRLNDGQKRYLAMHRDSFFKLD